MGHLGDVAPRELRGMNEPLLPPCQVRMSPFNVHSHHGCDHQAAIFYSSEMWIIQNSALPPHRSRSDACQVLWMRSFEYDAIV